MRRRILDMFTLVISAVLLTACFVPSPIVRDKHVSPPQAGQQTYTIEAVVENKGLGAGQVNVEAAIISKSDGSVLAQDSKQVDIDPGASVHVVFDLDLPPSAGHLGPSDVDVDVQASYPD